MKVIRLAVSLLLAICITVGIFSIFSHISNDRNVVEILKPPKAQGGTLHTYYTFDNVTLVPGSDDTNYYLSNDDGKLSRTQFYIQPGYGEFTLDGGEATYVCTATGSPTTYPTFKLRSDISYVYLSDVSYVMGDIDIKWDVVSKSENKDAELKILFNLRNSKSDVTGVSILEYFNVLENFGYSGDTHLTFIFEKNSVDLKSSVVYVYCDGSYLVTLEDFFLDDVTPDMLSCLNIRLPRTEGSTVTIDNFQLRVFEQGYDGALVDYLKDPTDPLKKCSDSIFYKD